MPEAMRETGSALDLPELVVSLNFAYVSRAGGVQDFANNLVQAMVPQAAQRLTVVRPACQPGRLGQMLMRYASELLLEMRYWRHSAVALFPNYFIFPVPLSRLRRVVVVHDLQFKHYPQYTHPIKRLVLNLSYRWVQRFADGVVFISAATRDDFLVHYGSPRRHAVIYNPIALASAPKPSRPRNFPYVVANFHYYPHKNLARLLVFHQALRKQWPELKLLLTGHRPPDLDALAGGDATAAGIEHLGFVSKAEVIEVVQGATFFMSLSQFEGFNMSAAEAALMGKPLVLSDIAVHREVFGDVALLVDPQSDPAPVQQILDHVRARAQAPVTWVNAHRVAPNVVAKEYLEFMQSSYSSRPLQVT